MKKILIGIICCLFVYAFHQITHDKKNIPQIKDVLIVGTSADYPPYASIDLKTGKIVGFDIDIAQEVARRLNKKIEIKDMPFNSLIFDLFAGQIDMIAAGLTPDERRKKTVLFSKSYLDSDPLLLVTKKENPAIKKLSDVYGKPIAVNTGYTCDMYLSTIPEICLVRLESTADALMALQADSIYGFACSQSSLHLFLKTQKKEHSFQFFMLPTQSDSYALAFAKTNRQLQAQVNIIIDTMEQDQTLATLKEKWGI